MQDSNIHVILYCKWFDWIEFSLIFNSIDLNFIKLNFL